MFSGIIEETGIVEEIEKKPNLCVLKVRAKKVLKDAKLGSSIAVDGVCLTVTAIKKDILSFDIMLETMKKTTLGSVKPKTHVNLERSLKMSDRICGHFVSGHVDAMQSVTKIITGENYTELRISLTKELHKYVVPKGSVALDGVSLTVGDVRQKDFSVYLIPFTLQVTNLGYKKEGSPINIETDILAKYLFAQSRDKSSNPYSFKKDNN
ncbi:MAG: riboflavin synthase [Candidatus Omnitrophica bacterium]|nr:riboflavin synthase [Candidatus Omnitrophota bacterium]